jgi:hypothetical protein
MEIYSPRSIALALRIAIDHLTVCAGKSLSFTYDEITCLGVIEVRPGWPFLPQECFDLFPWEVIVGRISILYPVRAGFIRQSWPARCGPRTFQGWIG